MKKIAIIIPCYNEEESLPQLFEKLILLEKKISHLYDYQIVFVDDGSKDNTFQLLQKLSHQIKSFNILRHDKNQNLGAALKTGINENLNTDYLLFLDSDCTYEPDIVVQILAKLDQNYDLATVSPYHPDGGVEGVPAWRLLLSSGLSIIYRILLISRIYTFTAMVRGIQTSKVKAILSDYNDFSFVAECLIKAIKLNYKIVEIPTILKVRKYGQSKMNIYKTIKSHIKIILKLLSWKY